VQRWYDPATGTEMVENQEINKRDQYGWRAIMVVLKVEHHNIPSGSSGGIEMDSKSIEKGSIVSVVSDDQC
jgi:hypothetical protein